MIRNKLTLIAALAVAVSPLAASGPALAQDETRTNQFWWPGLLNLEQLRAHDARSNPYGDDFDYA
ncbi:MAG: hypothetical protein GWP62_10740, partial [Gammaproteobacteria bacterium]|nr:hypothetical protein [Gammaproteobacteria bacterium]